MITSISKELFKVKIPKYTGEIKMLPFDLSNLNEVPDRYKKLVTKMISFLPNKEGIAYLTIDGKKVNKGETQRRGGIHVDGNYLKEGDWSNGGGNGWKVGEGGSKLTSEEHKKSYKSKTGGMIITSTYSSSKGWNGKFKGNPKEGGDCSHIKNIGEGFTLKSHRVYYGNSQFLHESLPLNKKVHRTIVRITLPKDYPVIYENN